ncbi:MAG TPA: cytochrome c oxidase assembly protein [Thermomicrobiales bacterium]|nr:cytochrome c oxidase assembly protein [Thermomicrobiales bacterium]
MLFPLHVGFPENPGLWSWQFEPTVIVGVAVAGYLYFRWIKLHQERHPDEEPVNGAKKTAFVLGLATFIIALLSPVDAIASYLLTMHMTQHILLTIVGPPLLLMGLPTSMYASFASLGTPWNIWRKITRPLVAFFLFNATFALIHLPIVYNLILRNEIVHIASHLLLIGTALLSWWSVFAPGKEYGELTPAIKSLYLLAHTVPGQIVGAIITLSDGPLYVEYVHAPLRVWGLHIQTDQEIGGLLMWTGVGTYYLIVAGIAFYKWASEADNKERDRLVNAGAAR